MLSFANVEKYYGKRLILQIPSFRLDNGIYWVQGANGSGKTTLLRMIAGLLPFKGDILLNEYSLHHAPADYRRCVSWSDAEPLYPEFLTGSDLLSFYQKIRKTPVQEVNNLINLFGMQHYIHTATGTYSSGMLKKLSLVLAFTGNVPLIVLDETLTTLDKEAVPVVFELIKKVHKENGVNFLLSSHQRIDNSSLQIDKELLIADHTLKFSAWAH
jgi:ABC-2 type transport system ATP-binding protein